ncbi:TIR domain-containing protein [Streptomyces graminifolii]|uniref:TIR domain-containing protein n=1 Tax=Streptomyces graminifolii TaxID=1266771 RepID=UPI004058FE4B
MNPSVFIGSSHEARPIAEALFDRLKDDATVTIWDSADIFAPTGSELKSLVAATGRFDFAIFIFSDDDLTISGSKTQTSPRDNVVFELGLFMGVLGQDRTFVAYAEDSHPKLPSDLAGITVLSYPTTGYTEPTAAVTGVASRIRRRIHELGTRKERLSRNPVVYWCGPHSDRTNQDVKAALERHKFSVRLPDDLTVDMDPLLDAVGQAAEIRRLCCAAIEESDVVAVNLHAYGLDSAWEMGYAEALRKPIIGFNQSDELLDVKRIVNKWLYHDNFMHGWDEAFHSADLDEVIERCAGKVTYLFCPYKNEAALRIIGASTLESMAKKLIISNRDLGIDPQSPATYSWRARKRAIQLLRESEIILTVLPRYGMDTAWKLGYAAALKKRHIGWVTEDFGSERSQADFLDHWMHGWRKKPVVSSIQDLATFIKGLRV